MAVTLVFVHGFMGNEETFHQMPQDLVELLRGCFPDQELKWELFLYDSKGNMNAEKLYDFIRKQPGDCHLVSHSMGGVLSLDCLRIVDPNRPPLIQLKGVVSIDTPYFGLSVDVLDMNSHSSLVPEPIKKIAQSTYSSKWSLFAAATAVTAGLAFAATSSSFRETVVETVDKVKGHLYDTSNFLGPLWNVTDMEFRFDILKERPDLYFSGIYLQLKDLQRNKKTQFTAPPPPALQNHFQPLLMNVPTSVVDAHMHMFDSKKDPDAYSELLIMVMQKLRDSISISLALAKANQ